MKFCDKLSKIRKDNNFSQEQLADKLGMSRQAVSKWESGSSYPDMKTMIQICKILNCKLDDLMDDGSFNNNVNYKSNKNNFNNLVKDLLDFITKSYNMFCSMTLIEKFKCIIELALIVLCLLLLFTVAGGIVLEVIRPILNLFPYSVYNVIYSILNVIFLIIKAVIIFIVTIHLFKIRYLDYYVTIEDSNVSKKTIEKPVDEKIIEKEIEDDKTCLSKRKNQEKIIIRDPKHSSFSFLELMAKILLAMFKMILFFIAIFFAFTFILEVCGITLSIFWIKYNLMFLGIMLSILGIFAINYIILEIIYKILINRKQSYRLIFIVIISGLILIGSGGAFAWRRYMNMSVVSYIPKESEYKSDVQYIDDDVNKIVFQNYYNILYIIDNGIDNVKIDIEYLGEYKLYYSLYSEEHNEYYIYHIYNNDNNIINNNLNIILKGMKDDKIYEIAPNTACKIKVYLNETNYNIIKNNNEKFNENF